MPKSESKLYELHQPRGVTEVAPFVDWLYARMTSQEENMSLVLRDGALAFGSSSAVWVFPISPGVDSPLETVMWAALEQNLFGQNSLANIVLRDSYDDLIALAAYCAPWLSTTTMGAYLRLAPLVSGDLRAAGRTIDWDTFGHGAFESIADDAYGLVVQEAQFNHGAPKYYEAIGIPFAKLQAEAQMRAEDTPGWYVTYPNLWLHVLAHYTNDPIMQWAFREDRDPLEAIAIQLSTDMDTAQALLVWQLYNRDLGSLQRHMAPVVEHLPAELPMWGLKMDRKLPALVAGVSSLSTAYWQNRAAHTLYGRKLRPGKEFGEASAFTIFGTVEDIVANAAVTFWKNRTGNDIAITRIIGGPLAASNRIGGPGSGTAWMYMLRELAHLGNPLKVAPLKPIVQEA